MSDVNGEFETTQADATETRFQAVEDEARRVIDHIAPVEWDVHVWTDGPTLGRLDRADALRLVKRVLSLSLSGRLDHNNNKDDS